ncbi:hypothetical protein CPAR01_03211 [Colletotrichum paranaense]|uniref:Uncharacterized protein n=1 Tax=Colletotrichum paranaense TaxID=1914294 RepID=A0ABQ9T2I2_9PEZI|nr:uncharacterized protein CPAR01_03211 [Colletotrichum paranaense]KAK1545709.1 hypothetical protein CPAR01_03211 [Colletotrichum paranaense]
MVHVRFPRRRSALRTLHSSSIRGHSGVGAGRASYSPHTASESACPQRNEKRQPHSPQSRQTRVNTQSQRLSVWKGGESKGTLQRQRLGQSSERGGRPLDWGLARDDAFTTKPCAKIRCFTLSQCGEMSTSKSVTQKYERLPISPHCIS